MHSAFRFALLASSALLLSACATQGSDIGNALAGHSFTWDASAVAQAEQTPSPKTAASRASRAATA